MLSARNILKTLRQKYNPFYSFRDFSLSITPSWFYRNLFILKKKPSFAISAIDETQHPTIWGRHERSDDRYSGGYFLMDIEFVVDLTFISAHNIFISFSSFLHFFKMRNPVIAITVPLDVTFSICFQELFGLVWFFPALSKFHQPNHDESWHSIFSLFSFNFIWLCSRGV